MGKVISLLSVFVLSGCVIAPATEDGLGEELFEDTQQEVTVPKLDGSSKDATQQVPKLDGSSKDAAYFTEIQLVTETTFPKIDGSTKDAP